MIGKEVYMSEDMTDVKVKKSMESNGRHPHPSREDSLEVRIRGVIEDQAFSTDLGRKMFDDSRSILTSYFGDALENVENTQYVHDFTQETLKQLAQTTNSRIVSGQEKLDSFPKGSPVFAATNHYSGYKLMDIEQQEYGVNFPDMDYVVPFPFFFSSLSPVAEKLEDNLYDAHQKMPDIFGKIQEEAGLLVIPKEGNSYEDIKRKTESMVAKRPNSLIVIFPEGETSGKRNSGSPYDLVGFHGGSFAIAQELGIPVIPVCQYFNPESGFEVGILDPVDFKDIPQSDDKDLRREYFSSKAEDVRKQMQSWLDQRQQSS